MNWTDFIEPLPQTSIMLFREFKNKLFLNSWLDSEPYGKNQCKKKEYNEHSSGFKEFKNNNP